MNDTCPAETLVAGIETGLRGALAAFLDAGALFDALNALSLLDAARSDTALTELALAWRRRGDAERLRPARKLTLAEFFGRAAARYAPEQSCSRAVARSLGNVFCRALGPDLPMEALRAEDVDAVLGRYASARTYNGMASRLRGALRWGGAEGLCDAALASRIARRQEVFREPAFFAPDRVERIFRTAEAHPGDPEAAVGAVLSLGFFAGVRTVEIARAAWEDLDLDGGVLRIPRPKGWTRGMRPRIVELEPNAAAWLRYWKTWTARRRRGREPRGPVVPNPRLFAEWKKTWLAPAGDSWGRDAFCNVMRHSYATHHVGAFRDAAATALNMGHGRSTAVLEAHYRGLVPRSVAEKYWKILPSDERR